MQLFHTPSLLSSFLLDSLDASRIMTLVTRNPPAVAKAAILAEIHRFLTICQSNGDPHVSAWTTSIRHIAGFRSPDIAEYEVASHIYDLHVLIARSVSSPSVTSESL